MILSVDFVDSYLFVTIYYWSFCVHLMAKSGTWQWKFIGCFFLKGGWSLKVVTNIANPFAKQTPNEYLEGAESNLILPNFGSSTHILIRHIHIPHIGLLKFFLQTFPQFSLSNIPYCAAHWSFLEQTFYNGLEIHRCLSNLKLKDLMFHCSCYTYLLFTFLWFTF